MAEGTSSQSMQQSLRGRRGGSNRGGGTGRLPSIRTPRDLTLGGVRKKTFTPNIPSRARDKSSEGGKDTFDQSEEKKQDKKKQQKSEGRGRGRGRGRGHAEVIQSHSIFELGPGAGTSNRASGSASYGYNISDRQTTSRKTTGSLKHNVDDAQSKALLDDLLRDDFIADDIKASDPNYTPISLPMSVSLKKEIKDEAVKSEEAIIKVKQEPTEESDDTKHKSATSVATGMAAIEKTVCKGPQTVAELFTSMAKTEYGDLMFIQMPDVLPGVPPKKEDEEKTSITKGSSESNATPSSVKQESKDQLDLVSDKLGLCSLSDFSEGYIGKLQIRKSGKTQLILGNVALDVTMGKSAGFLQDLVSIRQEGRSGNMCVLGHITNKLVCQPDMDALLSETS